MASIDQTHERNPLETFGEYCARVSFARVCHVRHSRFYWLRNHMPYELWETNVWWRWCLDKTTELETFVFDLEEVPLCK